MNRNPTVLILEKKIIIVFEDTALPKKCWEYFFLSLFALVTGWVPKMLILKFVPISMAHGFELAVSVLPVALQIVAYFMTRNKLFLIRFWPTLAQTFNHSFFYVFFCLSCLYLNALKHFFTRSSNFIYLNVVWFF